MSELTEFLLARIAEDEEVAWAAVDPERPGTHWGWFENDTDAAWTPVSSEFRVSLRTLEEFPTRSVGMLPAFALGYVEADGDAESNAMPHIARHDPARVLAECEAKRAIVEAYEYLANDEDPEVKMLAWTFALKCLALPHVDHPDYQEAWTV